MPDVLNPNYLNYPEQVQKNKNDIEKLNKVYKTTQNLTSSTTTLNINTTNIVDLNNCIIDRFLFSRNGLLFKIKSFTNETLYVEFYSDLSSTNEVITNFEFNPDVVVYENGNARIIGTIKYNQDSLLESVEAPAEINIPLIAGEGMVIDANEENDKIELHIDNNTISNPNLLINGDFRVNQRGQASYTGSIYGLDRWQGSDHLTVTPQSNGGVQLSASGGQGYYIQRIEDTDSLWGKTLTMSFSINGVVYSATSTLPNSRPTAGGTHIETIWVNGIVRARLYYYASSHLLSYTLDIANGNTVTIDWSKLEISSVVTAFISRLYAEELALCQRYYQKLFLQNNASCPNSATTMYIGANLLQTMRTSPTLTVVTPPALRGQGQSQTVLDVSVNSLFDNMVRLLLTISNATTNQVYALLNGEITLDAEIY